MLSSPPAERRRTHTALPKPWHDTHVDKSPSAQVCCKPLLLPEKDTTESELERNDHRHQRPVWHDPGAGVKRWINKDPLPVSFYLMISSSVQNKAGHLFLLFQRMEPRAQFLLVEYFRFFLRSLDNGTSKKIRHQLFPYKTTHFSCWILTSLKIAFCEKHFVRS